MKDKLQKKDMTFLLALAGFGFLCVLRYYNENMMQHLWALSILGNRRIIQGMTAVFFLILIGVAGQALRKVSKENRSGIYYMATLLAVCLMPMFICDSYMGSPDLYAWVIILLCIVALLDGRCDGIVLPGILLAAYICPMIVFSGGALLFAAVLAKGMCEDNKRNMVRAAGMVVMAFVAFVLAKETYGFATDVQGRISGKRFLVIVLLFLPYIYAIFQFFASLINEQTDGRHRLAYLLCGLGSVPGFLLWAYLGDYCRAVIYAFVYYLLLLLILYCQDLAFQTSWNTFRLWIKEKVVLEPVVVIYPLIILTFWMVSNDFIDAESIIEFTR
ncbi:MAG: hypothetical protein EGR77_06250 [Pseudobutyrivibrio sp.]|nr:hypothetical protein [Pseudobutyrivibrio sp.]